jgi:hypothetical protein
MCNNLTGDLRVVFVIRPLLPFLYQLLVNFYLYIDLSAMYACI